MDLGAIERDIAKQAIRSGEPIPDRILNAPKLRIGLEFFFNAFFDLDSDRPVGLALGRISWLAIRQYAEHYDLDDDQTDALIYFIRAMDVAHLKHQGEKK